MGLIGYSATVAMQKTIKQNRALFKKRESLKDIASQHDVKRNKTPFIDKKMSPIEFEAFKFQLKEKKRKQTLTKLLFILLLISGGALVLFLIFK